MSRKTNVLLILALALTMLFSAVSVAGANGAAADELVNLPPVTTPTESDDTEELEFEGTITGITLGDVSGTGTITVETRDNEDDAASLTPIAATTWTVHIDTDTIIRIGPEHEEGTIADLAVGQRVKVEGALQSDDTILAWRIHVKQEEDDDEVGFRGTIIAKSDEAAVTPLPTLTVQTGSRTITVVTDENTVIEDADGQPITFADLHVGQEIKGEGVLQTDGSILASEIEVLEDYGGPGHVQVRFEGRIIGLPNGLIGEWKVATTNTSSTPVSFFVDRDTKIAPPNVRPAVGDWVKVTAIRREDGTLLALKVHIKKDDPPRPVEFRGIIERIEGDPPTMIVVSVLTTTDAQDSPVEVLIDEHTRIEGELRAGAQVKVQGFLQDDGSVLARLIVVKYPEVEFRGRIESMERDVWVVAGVTVLITESTVITGAVPQVGLLAEVKGTKVGPRAVSATEIEVKDPSLEPVVIRAIIADLPDNVDLDDHIGTWTITTEEGNEVLVEVTPDTVINNSHGEVEIGALVCVTALRQDDGSLVAQRIKVFESD